MAKDVNVIVRENLHGLLDKTRMTQSALAQRIGVSQTSMSNYMYNRPFSVETLAAVADVFGVTINDLLTPDKYLSDSEDERIAGYFLCDQGARNLCNAITAQAARDYIQALLDGDKAEAKNCIRFFDSEWGHMVTGRNYLSVLKSLPDKVDAFKAKNRAAMKHGRVTFYVDSKSEPSFRCPVCGGDVFTHKKTSNRKNRNGFKTVCWSGKCNRCCVEHKIPMGEC